ncbi:TPA: RNase adapter RapZ [Mannheimia haemolytica]|uniref:RNase adapter RapZ n=2 Tax=Mannheimia haemolytica TaxID=75985 RepID=A0A547ET13_MANHA|nr:RNase adapter RapZ [Mannheimia haemolytica]AWW70847.1 RNase adapter RapZ [Pasteurellaceae bacterium 12565]AGI31937.1 RNase adapter RapZ [Mannheimia haemolytica USDA-ARS-USMARC-183]AGK03231.1 putative GlmZ(sRNA)-inactivating NTPase [Mannheimia haemolytica M42548]AGQ25305.1 glmZ(sRNA)-inactivating NTPase [Mannheimia haemolytica D153]AGQ40863.1 glmZ(sRNA)-inactivating NTPase [Mannheimia haemolytica D174]
MELIIISGRSGSGKSVALRALEDAGYYCVDNIPLPLIPTLTYYLTQENRSAVISLDIRNLPNTPNAIEELLTQLEPLNAKLIFLDCERNTLIRRYSDSRRIHPLSTQDDLSLEGALDLEQKLLEPLVQNANYIIDTSHLSSHELAENLRQILQGSTEKELKIIFQSFGFKYGLPADSDYVFDVRFLPNPHWNPELRPMTGLEQPVIDFLERQTEVHNFIYQTRNYLEMWLPMLEQNNRSYLTIAIGCTGGKHRSIFIAEQLAKYFQAKGKNVQVRHKSLEKHHKKTS